jgi:hypothetical protein
LADAPGKYGSIGFATAWEPREQVPVVIASQRVARIRAR